MMKTRRARSGLGFELLAVAISIGAAIGLTADYRATAIHIASLWFAVLVAAIPPILTVVGTRGAVLTDTTAALLLLLAILGCFTIGGLVLAVPALLLVVAAGMHHLATPHGAIQRRPLSIGILTLGAILFVGGFLSMGPGVIVAPIGLILIMWGSSSLGTMRAASRDLSR